MEGGVLGEVTLQDSCKDWISQRSAPMSRGEGSAA